MRSAHPHRWIAIAAAISVGALIGAPSASVAAEGVKVGISSINQTKDGMTGVLTIRSADAIEVDAATLTATVDGDRAPITVDKASRMERRAMLVIDTSGSMGAEGMAIVRSASDDYLRLVPSDVLVGVASFANTGGVDLTPTKDRQQVARVVEGLRSRGDTSLYEGMRSAIQALGTTGDRSITLLSDGADTVSSNRSRDRSLVAASLKKAGVRVDVVRFKTNDPDATRELASFADAHGGSVVVATDRKAVRGAFAASARALDSQSQFRVELEDLPAGTHTLRLVGRVGNTPFDIKHTFTGAAGGPAAPQAPVAPAPVPPATSAIGLAPPPTTSWLIWFAAGLIGIAMLVLAAGSLAPARSRTEQRVAAIEQYIPARRLQSRSEGKTHATPITEQLIDLGERMARSQPWSVRIMALIERADLPLRLGEWVLLNVSAGILGGLLGYLSVRSPLGVAFGVLLGAVAPSLVLRFLARRRAHAFERVLPDVLFLVASSLRSGFGLPQALDSVSRDAAEPAAKEFARALAETRIGTDISDALDHMAHRMGSTSMKWTVMALRIQRDVGGNLADTLTTTATTLREREALYRSVRALSAEGRLSAVILIAMPIIMFFYMTWANYEYISLLWTRPLGIVFIVGGIGGILVGIFWMSRVVKIEV